MEKKIRITLPIKSIDILENDIEEFDIKKNYILNYIYEELSKSFKENLEQKELEKEETRIIQFNLNKKNLENYYNFLEENKIQNESEFFRNIIRKYTSQSKKDRELFLFKNLVFRINYAIKERKKIKITFKDGKTIEVEAYSIESSKFEVANYLLCYNIKEKKWKNYKIKYMKSIYIKNESFSIRDKDFLEIVKKDFDPFLSNGQIVKVKLTLEGEVLFKELRMNRPKIIEKKDMYYTLECSNEKAKRYFSYFLDEVEIIYPLELREWFKNKYKKAYLKYE